MKRWALFFLVLGGWHSYCFASDALDRVVYQRDFTYSKGTVSVVVTCTWDNQYCKIRSDFGPSTTADLEHKIGILQERDGIEDAINHLIALHIDPRSLHGIATKRITNPEERDMLALAAIRSEKWRHLMATYQTPNPDPNGELHSLFGKLLLSSGAYDPLNALLAKYGLKVTFIGVEKVMDEKFYKLHILAPGVNSNDRIRVPIDGLVTLGIRPIVADRK